MRGCRQSDNYDAFIDSAEANIPAAGFKRPLEDHHAPSTASGNVQPLTFPTLPGVTITVLHSEEQPTASDCSYRINNASIVTLIEIDNVRFVFTGDANGKERDEASPGTPGHVEQSLLDVEAAHPGTLAADVLKAPHHGSETGSTQTFINTVDPDFIIISASTIHHLPRDSVITRYGLNATNRIILRTDGNRASGIDHLVCMRVEGDLTCHHEDVFDN